MATKHDEEYVYLGYGYWAPKVPKKHTWHDTMRCILCISLSMGAWGLIFWLTRFL